MKQELVSCGVLDGPAHQALAVLSGRRVIGLGEHAYCPGCGEVGSFLIGNEPIPPGEGPHARFCGGDRCSAKRIGGRVPGRLQPRVSFLNVGSFVSTGLRSLHRKLS